MLAIIGQAIRQLREENGISPEELAARANITTEQLHCIETNRTTPSFRVLLRRNSGPSSAARRRIGHRW